MSWWENTKEKLKNFVAENYEKYKNAPKAPTYKELSIPTAEPDLRYVPFSATDEGMAKKTAVDNALTDFNNFGKHQWVNEEVYQDWLDKKLNRDAFSYDLNSDALYKQYADQYRSMGKLAMEDTMGRAAMMTGGYGNSYAATAGNQAYQAYLGELNDVIPELYQMALNKYTMEGEQIDSNIAALAEDYGMSFDKWSTEYGMRKDKYDVVNSDYYNSASLYDSEQDSLNDIALKQAQWDEEIRQSGLDEYWREKTSGGILDSGLGGEKPSDDGLVGGKPSDDGIIEDTETADTYASWTGIDWNEYFSKIRLSEGIEAANTEFNRMFNAGFIPSKYVSVAASGARGGKLGR